MRVGDDVNNGTTYKHRSIQFMYVTRNYTNKRFCILTERI